MLYIILQIIEVRDYIFTRGCIHGFGEWLGQHDELIVIAALSTMVMQVSINMYFIGFFYQAVG